MSNRIPQHEQKRVDFIPSPQKLPVGGSDPKKQISVHHMETFTPSELYKMRAASQVSIQLTFSGKGEVGLSLWL